MSIVIATTVGTRKETPRIWLQGLSLAKGEFNPNTRYNVSEKDGTLVLTLAENGQRKVSSRGNSAPIIDLNNRAIGELFPVGTKLHAIVRKGVIILRKIAIARRALKRDRRILDKIRTGQPLQTLSMFHGGGVMASAISRGFKSAGIQTELSVVAEIEQKALDASMRANADLFTDRTMVINAPVQDLRFDNPRQVEIAELGLPCIGFSKSGKAKRHLSCAEEHPQGGALFFSALQWISAFNPAVIVMECTPELIGDNSTSIGVIRSVLTNWKYDLFEMPAAAGNDWGALENRKRAVIIAMSHDLAESGLFDLDQIIPVREKEENVAEIMEELAEDDPRWRIYEYLETKEASDKAAGKGFMRQLYTGEEEAINTLTAGLWRIRSTDPQFKHPTKERYTRLPTAKEHGRCKGFPEGMIEAFGVAESVAHQIAGNSVIYPLFEAIGRALAVTLKRVAKVSKAAVHQIAPNTQPQMALAV